MLFLQEPRRENMRLVVLMEAFFMLMGLEILDYLKELCTICELIKFFVSVCFSLPQREIWLVRADRPGNVGEEYWA
jgi:hypothetical protein